MRAPLVLFSVSAAIQIALSCSPPNFSFEPVRVGTCTDRLLNGKESSVDCGGECRKCDLGEVCNQNADCANNSCVMRMCQALHCGDNDLSGNETDIDCGGGECSKCAPSQNCLVLSDCRSNSCVGGECVSTTCDDKNIGEGSDETDIDCGGMTCPACKDGKRCGSSADCVNGRCVGNICRSVACTDNMQGPDELGVDCGGPCPVACDPLAACSDKMVTLPETDVDCGGGTCPACDLDKTCISGTDCSSGYCLDLKCAIDPCIDDPASCDPQGTGGAPTETGGTSATGGAPDAGTGGVPAEGGSNPGSGGIGGAGGTGGTAGATDMGGAAGEGGSPPAGGMGGTTGGTGTGGAPPGPLTACSGCARLTVPLTAATEKANYVIFLPGNTDMSNAVITYRVYKEAGTGGEVKGYVQHSGTPDYGQLFQTPPMKLADMSGWHEIVFDVGTQATTYDETIVARIGFQVTGATGTSWTNPTIVTLDSITVTGASVGPWSFDNSSTIQGLGFAAPNNVLFLNEGDSPVTNSGISWLGP